jgi:hypothetical protein
MHLDPTLHLCMDLHKDVIDTNHTHAKIDEFETLHRLRLCECAENTNTCKHTSSHQTCIVNTPKCIHTRTDTHAHKHRGCSRAAQEGEDALSCARRALLLLQKYRETGGPVLEDCYMPVLALASTLKEQGRNSPDIDEAVRGILREQRGGEDWGESDVMEMLQRVKMSELDVELQRETLYRITNVCRCVHVLSSCVVCMFCTGALLDQVMHA